VNTGRTIGESPVKKFLACDTDGCTARSQDKKLARDSLNIREVLGSETGRYAIAATAKKPQLICQRGSENVPHRPQASNKFSRKKD